MRSDLAAASAASLRQLEGWARGEMLAVAGKLKHVAAAVAAQQEQARLQFEALQQQWEGAAAAADALRGEDRRLKRHVSRLERKTEELQQAAATAAGAESSSLQQLRADAGRLAARVEQLAAAGAQRGAAADEAAAQLRRDVASLAEHVGSCLEAAARGEAAAQAGPGSVSYLGSLLAPPAAAAGGGAGRLGAQAVRSTTAPWVSTAGVRYRSIFFLLVWVLMPTSYTLVAVAATRLSPNPPQ
jgi:hypothetical protein